MKNWMITTIELIGVVLIVAGAFGLFWVAGSFLVNLFPGWKG